MALNLKDFHNFEVLASPLDLGDDQKQSDLEMQEMELESLATILNQIELQVLDKEQIFNEKDPFLAKITRVLRLSLIPNSAKKFVLLDEAKGITVELRCLPALDLVVALPESYPSSSGPLFLLQSHFYEGFKPFLYEQLGQKWSENYTVVYDLVVSVQDDVLNSFFDQSALGNVSLNEKGQAQFRFSASPAFNRVYQLSVEAQRRSFNNEEHACRICERNLLGNKFFFLSGCEHYFCHECVTAMVTQALDSMQISQLVCPDKDCRKNMNDLDIRNLGLSQA